ncbi:putative TIM-barrel fold metal-dependent hydrolase [Desulfitobacterium dichloroeliminans LMG P-21439]|uniref:Putative TIM-barrel fold metal-dependent hydrolase n=1 Tax=Desulfitobacterium dichloroeliminans (strain LMG P-21439 / DCA1) TaxID=871963 RepID=L0F8C6_DESDL|nr:amidohydrolase family protein [Desulfitobacterium dichloroeliminans]AGA69290.1 putative TIM-barrel fold metal-dependent hydrolase [Desulfitobacterium dichloroeliminans LMG P-21439]
MAKYKIIDWRLRPPFGSFLKNKIFNDPNFSAAPTYPESARQFSMDLLINEMNECGVEIGMVPFRKGQDQGDIGNLLDAYSERFQCMAHIDPYAENPIKDIDDLIVEGRAKCAIIEPGQYFIKKPVPANDKILYPIYEKCQAENIVLTITFGGLYCEELELYNPIFIDKVAKDFPHLKMVLTHGGWPYTTEICHVAYQRANVYLSPDCYFTALHPGYQSYVTAANNVLQDKFIFGSVYPGYSLAVCIDNFVNIGVKPEILPKIFYHNAAKLLGLE